MGHEIHSSGIVIHPDGTVNHYISGDLKPEVRAKIEAKIKAEQKEKAKRKKQYQKQSAEAAEKRRLLMKQYEQKQMMADALENRMFDTSNIFFVSQSLVVSSVVMAYENAISTFSKSVIENI